MNRISKIGATVLASMFVLACGGGGGGNPPAAPPPVADNGVPAEAQGSVNGMLSWLKPRVATASETAVPLDLANATLPVSDDGEPDGSI